MEAAGGGRPGVAAVVLAAGASARWGLRGPKSLAPIDGRPALEHVASTARSAGCDPVVAVVGSPEVAERLGGAAGIDRLVVHPEWGAGRTGSLRAGLEQVPRGSAAVVWPVDVPFVRTDTVAHLIRRAGRESLAVWVTPTLNGLGGHPIVLTSAGVALALRLPVDTPLRDAPFRRGLGEHRIPVDDPGVIDNTNYPEEFGAAERAWRARESIR